MTNESIAAGSTVGLKFSERFFITNATLTGCKATTSSASNPATMPCSVIYYSGSQVYEVTMTGIFATTTTYSFLRLAFAISNPYAEVSEPINLTIYTSGVMVGYGTAYISNYKASVMTGCSIQSASMLTYANATHTYTFTPPQRLLVNSYLLIEMPVWSSSALANEVTAFLICTGLQVNMIMSLGDWLCKFKLFNAVANNHRDIEHNNRTHIHEQVIINNQNICGWSPEPMVVVALRTHKSAANVWVLPHTGVLQRVQYRHYTQQSKRVRIHNQQS